MGAKCFNAVQPEAEDKRNAPSGKEQPEDDEDTTILKKHQVHKHRSIFLQSSSPKKKKSDTNEKRFYGGIQNKAIVKRASSNESTSGGSEVTMNYQVSASDERQKGRGKQPSPCTGASDVAGAESSDGQWNSDQRSKPSEQNEAGHNDVPQERYYRTCTMLMEEAILGDDDTADIPLVYYSFFFLFIFFLIISNFKEKVEMRKEKKKCMYVYVLGFFFPK
ncbi:hypothetical protein RFI_08328 [Reticulomyxa filosa]|uniref:Uncharacterized protein n=1 Tax=Reticulomyxa filosa TaxID=46433 RepID=X6NSR3_RETFI|nr:hypothetical protein RFI_08328 [Reticulomyxa filosa]|eukprot:ETO28799.1 hypothetical protein RFI_08328 [Reticulomyxa filosa]